MVAQAFYGQGVGIWSVGIVYTLYDTALLIFTAIRIRALAHSPSSSGGPIEHQSLGVIVAAYNEASVLSATINQLLAQQSPPDIILIADDGSTDETADIIARDFGIATPVTGQISDPVDQYPNVRYLRLDHHGKSHTLNSAISQIDCDIVLTVDADTILRSSSIAAIRAAFASEPELVAATGVLVPTCDSSPSGKLFEWFQSYEYVRNFLSRYAWEQQHCLLLISGAFAAFRRDALTAVGGFDSDCLVEDYELIHRLHRYALERGIDWRVRVIGNAVAYTDAPASPLAFLRQRRRWFGGFLQTQHWNRDMVGNRRFGQLGTQMLLVKAFDTIQPIYGLIAFAILLSLVVTNRFVIASTIVLIMLSKVAIDMAFHLWSLRIYKGWTGQRNSLKTGPAILAALAEPFSFQLLRHIGAIWGWFAFLLGRDTWNAPARKPMPIRKL